MKFTDKEYKSLYKFKTDKHILKNITYQGLYEKHFLDTYYDNLKIENGKRIKYNFDGVNRTYISDFYLPDYNLIIEIKSKWTFDKWKEKNLAKEQACLQQGFDFIIA